MSYSHNGPLYSSENEGTTTTCTIHMNLTNIILCEHRHERTYYTNPFISSKSQKRNENDNKKTLKNKRKIETYTHQKREEKREEEKKEK